MKPDRLKMVMVTIGAVLFIAGATTAYEDVTLDYHMGAWGMLGAMAAGLGVGLVWLTTRLD